MSGQKRPFINMGSIVMDYGTGQAGELSQFYSRLPGWELTHPAQNEAAATSPGGRALAFQETDTYAACLALAGR